MTFFRLGLGALLLFSGCPVWAATLTVGQSTVAGANVTTMVPVTLSSGLGESVVAVQFDLSFDGAALSLDSVTAGTTATAAGKDVSFSFPEEGAARIIISGFNQYVIASGTLATLGLTISSTISIGSHALSCSELVLSDALGDPVSAVAISGAIKAGGAVPSVVGLAQTAAQTALASVGLVVGTVSLVYSDVIAAGKVISESPTANTHVAYGATINLVVSKGSQYVSIPNVIGMTQAQAQSALLAAGLVLGAVTSEFSDTVAAGMILRQTPNSGTSVSSGAAVAVVLSKGPQNVSVPNVLGMTQTQAQNALVAAGLVLGAVSSENSETVAAGLVLRQTPSSGSTVSSGSAVDVVLSKGSQNVSVPNVVGTTQAAAQARLVAVGLSLGTVTSQYSETVAAGLVIVQNPAAGLAEASGTAVDVIVSKGSSVISVPIVVGMTQTAAQNILITAGLVLGDPVHAYSDSVEAGLVISQTPNAAATANVGAQVSIVISDGPAPAGCTGGTSKALGQGPSGGGALLFGAVLTLLSLFRRPKFAEA